MENRISLRDYSYKYSVSLSTLRRRIKAKEVDCILRDGKYLLLDKPLLNQSHLGVSSEIDFLVQKYEVLLKSKSQEINLLKNKIETLGSIVSILEKKSLEKDYKISEMEALQPIYKKQES